MERWGIKMLRKFRKKYPPDRIDSRTYILDEKERKEIADAIGEQIYLEILYAITGYRK